MKTLFTICLIFVCMAVQAQQTWLKPSPDNTEKWIDSSTKSHMICSTLGSMICIEGTQAVLEGFKVSKKYSKPISYVVGGLGAYYLGYRKERHWEDQGDIPDLVVNGVGCVVGIGLSYLFDRLELRYELKNKIQVRPSPFGISIAINLN